MPDIVELIPSDQAEAVFRAWEDGKGPQALAREFALTVTQVEQILDHMLPTFDARSNLSAFKRELRRLEELSGEFFGIAKRDKCRDSAHLVARLNERICAMRGWSPINVRMDPLEVQVVEKSGDGYDKIFAALQRVAGRCLPEPRTAEAGPVGATGVLPDKPDGQATDSVKESAP